mgnify:CR=1 FL=1
MLAHYKRTPTQKVTRGFSYLFMALCVCVALLPIIWVILSSFKTNSEIFSNGLSLPSHFGFDGYVQALEIAPILKFFANSLIVANDSECVLPSYGGVCVRQEEVSLQEHDFCHSFLVHGDSHHGADESRVQYHHKAGPL